MKLSRATQDLSHDVPTAYRKITHPWDAPETPRHNGSLEPNTSTTPANQVSAAAALMREDAITRPLHADTSTSAWNAGAPTHRTNAPTPVKRPTTGPDLLHSTGQSNHHQPHHGASNRTTARTGTKRPMSGPVTCKPATHSYSHPHIHHRCNLNRIDGHYE